MQHAEIKKDTEFWQKKNEGKRPFVRRRSKRDDNIQLVLRKYGMRCGLDAGG